MLLAQLVQAALIFLLHLTLPALLLRQDTRVMGTLQYYLSIQMWARITLNMSSIKFQMKQSIMTILLMVISTNPYQSQRPTPGLILAWITIRGLVTT